MPSQCQSFGLCVEPGFTRFQLVSLSLSSLLFIARSGDGTREERKKYTAGIS